MRNESNVHCLEFIDEPLMSCSSSALLRRPLRCICFTARSTWNYASGWFLDVLIVESEFSNSTLLHCIFSVGKLVEAFTSQTQTALKTSINIWPSMTELMAPVSPTSRAHSYILWCPQDPWDFGMHFILEYTGEEYQRTMIITMMMGMKETG